jgi:sec-independent protein translocase protein TatA
MELIIILVIVLLVFGAGRLPEIGSAMGKGLKEFKSASKEIEQAKVELETGLEADTKIERNS